ncbi:MAG: apolipoprotein N-acyltransferase [Sulfurospirillaceae bacterium]|nr:apolipoprotein N-acyltransferase [Sulfurospirillaceae bacterium]
MDYSNTLNIIKAFFIALCLCSSFYLGYFSIHSTILNSILALIGFSFLLGANKGVYFWFGFFTGALWFYWISFSFIYYELAYLMPLIIIGIALFYGVVFGIIGFFSPSPFWQAFFLFLLTFFEPFGFNWLKLELPLVESYFGTEHWQFALFLFGIALLKLEHKKIFILGIIPLFCSVSWTQNIYQKPDIDVYFPNTNVSQKEIWSKAHQQKIISENFKHIEDAIEAKKELIILPESAFPLYLNLEQQLLNRLKEYSKQITIVAGSLTYENKNMYNSSYLIQNTNVEIAHKVLLVPFGEEVPFPEFLTKIINDIFFNGAKDYIRATKPTDFRIKDIIFRNAICFEATKDRLYEGNPSYMIAISNNGWFKPSIEQTLQNRLLKLYAKRYNTVIFHSANSGISGVILP